MALYRRSIIAFLAFFMCWHIVYSQLSNSETGPQFRVISLAKLATLFYDYNDELKVVNAGLGSFSPLYPAPVDRNLLFYREEPNPDPTKPPIKVTIAEAKLPASEGPFLLLLKNSASASELEFDLIVVDHSLNAHPVNHYRVFNFSKRRMAIRLAEQDMLLDSGKSGTVLYPNNSKAWLKVAAENEKEGWLVVTSSSHAVGTDSRTTVFLVDILPSERDPDPLGIVVRKMRERIVKDELGQRRVQ